MIMEILIADDEKYIREELKNTIERITPGNSIILQETSIRLLRK